MFPGSPVDVMSDEAKRQVSKKIEIAERLAKWIVTALPVKTESAEGLQTAIRDFLCVDLEQVQAMQDAFPGAQRATLEDLARAQQCLEATRQKIDFFETGGAGHFDDDPIQEGISMGIRSLGPMLLPDLRLQLQREEEFVSEIQKALEAQGGE